MASALNSQHFDLDDSVDVQEFYHSKGWTDGFPIVPPTPVSYTHLTLPTKA